MIVAEVSFVPIGKGESVREYVIGAIRKLRNSGLNAIPNSMATVIEGKNLDEIFGAVKSAEEEIFRMGAKRVDTILKIDHRIDTENSADLKMKKVIEGLGEDSKSEMSNEA